MERWVPATKQEVLREINKAAKHAGPEVWGSYSQLLIDPYIAAIERFGQLEQAFVVAKLASRVVFFEDVEEVFGTATESNGRLVDCAIYGDLRLALKEAAAGA